MFSLFLPCCIPLNLKFIIIIILIYNFSILYYVPPTLRLLICWKIDILGFMYLWDVRLNGISLVNLVMALGLTMEFTAHIVQDYLENAKRAHREDSSNDTNIQKKKGI